MSAKTGRSAAAGWLAVTLLAAAVMLGGCASPASREGMTVQEVRLVRHHPHSVGVGVQGGSETGALDSPNIDNAEFKAALESSIKAAKLFAAVVQGQGGDYELNVVITRIDKPLFGGSFTVEMDAGWSLVKAADRSVVMRKAIRSTYTATMGDAFVGVTRLRLAVEGAARDNIDRGLRAIAELNL